ncbi:MAG: TRAP transporter substrate-binding protein, partial [Lachnospiraceae bacterium]|nr:TRAP transporter substrate-binding protein [Lachnospiraceae bacterium]
QMVPDILLGNYAFLEGLSEEERAIFDEGFELLNQVQREEWTKAVEAAKEKAQNDQGVQFIYPDTAPFQEACAPLHEEVISGNETLEAIYAKIQEYNAMYPSAAE